MRAFALLKMGVAALVAALAVSGCQPKDESPGLWLSGDAAVEWSDDWRFTDTVDEIFVQTRPWYRIPHSTTIWCVELGGDLYVGSYGDEKKTWEKNLARDANVVLSISGKLYKATLTQVSKPAQVAALDTAYEQKYDMADVFGDELPDWWYYKVNPR